MIHGPDFEVQMLGIKRKLTASLPSMNIRIRSMPDRFNISLKRRTAKCYTWNWEMKSRALKALKTLEIQDLKNYEIDEKRLADFAARVFQIHLSLLCPLVL